MDDMARPFTLGSICRVLAFDLFPRRASLCFGIADASALYRDWIEALAVASTNHASGLSVKAGLAALLDRLLTDALVANVNTVAVGLWFLAVAAFFVPTLMRKAPASPFAAAAELAAILLVALPLGALQQPARGVALLIAMLIIAAAAFADGRSPWSRISLFAVLAFIGISSHVVPMGPLFALLTLPSRNSGNQPHATPQRCAVKPRENWVRFAKTKKIGFVLPKSLEASRIMILLYNAGM